MRYFCLATDYDSTLAAHGRVAHETVDALRAVKRSGRRLVLVTGRQVEDVLAIFPAAGIFDWIVGENGAVLHQPATGEQRLLGSPPPRQFLRELQRRRVSPLSVGKIIIASDASQEHKVLEAQHALGLELQLIFNKGGLMVLPSGVNKATGLKAALKQLGLSVHNVVGVGDAENDFSFLAVCECAVAVADALPMLKRQADFVTHGGEGEGVRELADGLLETDLARLSAKLERHALMLGERNDGKPLRIEPYGLNVLLAGTSGGGKSSLAGAFMEQLLKARYQFCIFDPEGDYRMLPKVLTLGDPRHVPSVEEVLDALSVPGLSCSANLLGMPLKDRPGFFQDLLMRLVEMRSECGRPHWIIMDEAHHLMPADWRPDWADGPGRPFGLFQITVHPEHLHPSAVAWTDLILCMGERPRDTLLAFAKKRGRIPEDVPPEDAEGRALAWWPSRREGPFYLQPVQSIMERRRHVRKYAEGELGPDKSFYFRGPGRRLNLRAQNLMLFLQLAEGVDDETWMFHLRAGDVAQWFREGIKDDVMAREAEVIAAQNVLDPAESRARIRRIVEKRYTAPA